MRIDGLAGLSELEVEAWPAVATLVHLAHRLALGHTLTHSHVDADQTSNKTMISTGVFDDQDEPVSRKGPGEHHRARRRSQNPGPPRRLVGVAAGDDAEIVGLSEPLNHRPRHRRDEPRKRLLLAPPLLWRRLRRGLRRRQGRGQQQYKGEGAEHGRSPPRRPPSARRLAKK